MKKSKVRPAAELTDTPNAHWLYPSDNILGIPNLQPIVVSNNNDTLSPLLPAWLAPYRTSVRNPAEAALGGLHFYLEDYRFESVWSRPVQTLSGLRQFGTLLTPDFSLCRNWPYAAQIWNTYRSRWCGAFWQSQGLRVVPTISWSYPASYTFCFLGLAPGGMVSISQVGLGRGKKGRYLFEQGFEAMLEHLRPGVILSYGQIPAHLVTMAAQRCGTELIQYPTRWDGLVKARRNPVTRRNIVVAATTVEAEI